MNVNDLEHKVETMENAAGRNLNTNDILSFIVTGIWQVALQVGKLTQAVGFLRDEIAVSSVGRLAK